ncbi:putative protein kinase RLK-Pelle-LRR-I-1 family [Helianthus annuus]|uniref:non-specific serine/threonine protein kinase n=3 Tax=Helianthus annuus TaxID=4232 RepID=A0A9K3P597_HELAN|nr:putative protein kinase RLK-Pelle-LRR-I-1 family [Helianthus annuus]KAJ0613281.1 putative protein kinase RLK-Pelle-LRR-I-1 family [Helianthus annuus]KAJ0624972.1 putative protein kinase RLK-Pelle-LRR-I-1 family [Helianthus annuus]KAJ0628639.1 putative protein kinase RLK-Pelle-LRR-I-1 family [Helianthus annuus]KAJ0784959.1 putative protein kinase RLK-Pelle-LRR-I-1 family [Helianthus annuus]
MRIREDDILTATKKFSEGHIVSGGFGSVYIAELEHVDKAYCLPTETENARELPKKRNIVAIKRIDDTEEMAEQGFYAEIELLTSCKHSNIIPLVGFCDEGDELILIYEYASSGSLNYQLQKMSNNHNDTWAQRLKICLGVAKGLSFLHTTKGDRKEVVHRDIKSANILLDGNFEAKIGDFGLSTFLSVSKDYTRYSTTIAGTPGYMDPQYGKDGKLKKESDVYSFGVVMFEILSGTVAYDRKYNVGLALEAKEHFENKKIKEMLDSKIKEEITRTLVSSIKGPNQESLDIFTKIAYKCLAEEQSERPTMEVVVQELENALLFQENRKDIFQISFEDVLLATDNFFDDRLISVGIYEGNVLQADGTITRVVAKRITMGNEVDDAVDTEFKVLMKYRHENVIALLGYCAEGEERVAVYEYMPYGGFNMYVHKESLTWGKRLEICIDIASGLDFLHGGSKTGEVVIHRDIKSSNILLDADMKAKIADFGLCVRHPIDKQMVLLDHIAGTEAYRDPEYERTCQLSKECDIYSFGILLFEILLRGLAGQYLVPFIKRLHKEGKLDELVFESTKEVVVPQSLTIFRRIAIQCLHEKREERPTAREVIIQLKKAFEIQVSFHLFFYN